MTIRKVTSTQKIRPDRLFCAHPAGTSAETGWDGPGAIKTISICNVSAAPVDYSIYDVGPDESAGIETALAYVQPVAVGQTVFFEFPGDGIGIARGGHRQIMVQSSVGGAITFQGYGEPG